MNGKTARMILYATIALVVAGILAAIGFTNHVSKVSTVAPALAAVKAGDAAPDFAVNTTHGMFSLARSHRPVLLEVFATWCPHCQRETRILNELYARYRNRVDFVAVSGSPFGADRQMTESLDDVNAFARYFHTEYPVAYDGTLGVANAYLQGGFPTLVVIDREKKVAHIASGEIAQSTLASWLETAR
ncbi:MAG: TlpA family protein disulfide reductase [Vulcanimicrobiaceae bacterium]